MKIRSRNSTTSVSAALAAVGLTAIVTACGAAPPPGVPGTTGTPAARSAHDDPSPGTEGHLTLEAGTEVDLDTDDVRPVSRTADVSWDGDRLTFPTGAEIVDDVEAQECADVLAASAGSASAGGTVQPSAVAQTIPSELLRDGAQACLRTDAGAVVHVEVLGPDIHDDVQIRVYGQRAQ